MKIKIKTADIETEAELNDTETAREIYNSLPLKGIVHTWGNEIYFEIPLHVGLTSDAKEEVEIGDLGFWPTGDCFCIFFGKTPASDSEKPKAASTVNIFGKVIGDTNIFKQVSPNEEIFIEK